jgi:hypothetical protein
LKGKTQVHHVVEKQREDKVMMRRTDFEETMHTFLRRQPFKPFVIVLDDGQQLVIEKREAVNYYTGDSALYFRADGSFDFVDCENVRQLLELTPTSPT